MPEAPVNPLIIARGKELFLLIWECLSGRSEWTSVNRFIQDDISDADRVLVLYAAFYAVNTKCEHCHAAYKRARRLSSQVVEGDDQFCLCSCCQAPSGYSDCVYCHRIEGALNLLAAVATGSGFTPDQWDDCLRRFRPAPIANIPFVGYLEVRTEIIEEEFQISDFEIEDIGLEDYLEDQHISSALFAEWIKAASLDQAGTLEEPEAENNSDSDTEDEPQPLVVSVNGG